jgi:cytochrome c-type biogenesis protein CcmH/NrfF
MSVLTPVLPIPFPRKRRKGESRASDINKTLRQSIRQTNALCNRRVKVPSPFTWGGVKTLTLLLIFMFFTVSLHAQENPSAPVTYDQVNAVAEKMYCPECENIPLDKCQTPVCIQWKSEIADQLAAGQSESEIINGFVARFGDQVLGIPQDPTLRNMAVIAPYMLAVVILIIGIWTFLRWRGNRPLATSTPPSPALPDDENYRSRLEKDLRL